MSTRICNYLCAHLNLFKYKSTIQSTYTCIKFQVSHFWAIFRFHLGPIEKNNLSLYYICVVAQLV